MEPTKTPTPTVNPGRSTSEFKLYMLAIVLAPLLGVAVHAGWLPETVDPDSVAAQIIQVLAMLLLGAPLPAALAYGHQRAKVKAAAGA